MGWKLLTRLHMNQRREIMGVHDKRADDFDQNFKG